VEWYTHMKSTQKENWEWVENKIIEYSK
jgi:hypothetical protein